jgi:hypothetical protein
VAFMGEKRRRKRRTKTRRHLEGNSKIEFITFLSTNALFIKHKILQLTLKISLYMAATCFGPFGPSSGSICRDLAKVTVFVELLVKIHR